MDGVAGNWALANGGFQVVVRPAFGFLRRHPVHHFLPPGIQAGPHVKDGHMMSLLNERPGRGDGRRAGTDDGHPHVVGFNVSSECGCASGGRTADGEG